MVNGNPLGPITAVMDSYIHLGDEKRNKKPRLPAGLVFRSRFGLRLQFPPQNARQTYQARA